MFLLDKTKFVRHFTRPRLRKPKNLAWGKVQVWHVFELWNELYQYFLQIVADLTVTITTDVFQARLRTLYPNVGAFKCFVKNQYELIPNPYMQYLGEHHLPEYDYLLTEAQPPLYEKYLQEMEPYDYHIVIPVAYSADAPAITFLCNKYKPAGKRYQLIFQNITS